MKHFIVAVIVILALLSEANAATYYVRTDGHDTASGANNTADASTGAWLTIQHAADTVAAGDTVLVASGNYAGFWTDCAGTVGNPITFKAIVTGGAVITSNNSRTTDGINLEHWSGTANYITVDGFVVSGRTRMGIRAIGGTGVIIKNCRVYSNGDSGILSGDTPGIQIIDNTCYSNGNAGTEHNIYISNAESDNPIIRGNIVYSAPGGNGIQLNGDWEQGGDGYIDGALIEDNIVYSNTGKGFSLISVRNSTIRNNVTYDNGGAAAFHIVEQLDSHYSSGNTIVNNTSHETGTVCVRINSGNTGNVVFNNICVYNGDGIVFEGSGNYESNNFEVTAVGTNFEAAANRDYHLAAGSTAIGYGAATYQSKTPPTDDFDGTARATVDAGAFEYVDGDDFFYVSPYGTGTACTLGRPCATVTAGVTALSGGGTLTVNDGVYAGRISGIANGAAGDYTIVRAKNDAATITDGTAGYDCVVTMAGSYTQIEGFKVISTASTGLTQGSFMIPNGGHHNKVLRCGFSVVACTTSTCENRANVDVSGYNNLLEDCWAWGGGRYKFVVFGGDNATDGNLNILRRCVARHDREYTGGYNPQAAFANYQGKDNFYQNCISIDSDQLTYYDGCWRGPFFLEKGQKGGAVTISGCIALNYGTDSIGILDNSTMSGAMYDAGNISVSNSAFLYGPQGFTGYTDVWTNGRTLTVDHSLFANITRSWAARTFYSDAADGSAFSGGTSQANTNATSTNTVYWNVNQGASGGYALYNVRGSNNYNAFYGNRVNYGSSSVAGANDITATNPASGSILYPVRVETGSTFKGAGAGGTDIGPSIMKRIGVSGTVYGQTGYNTTTDEDLWPWPTEARIKSDMSAYPSGWPANGLPDPVRGFTASGTQLDGTSPITLTSYIWEYLGNEMPADLYGDAELPAPGSLMQPVRQTGGAGMTRVSGGMTVGQ